MLSYQVALRIRDAAKRTAEGIILIGQWLSEAKAKLKHGQWLPWLETEFAWREQTARNFMNVYAHFKSPTVGEMQIDVSALYLIAAPKTPEPVRQEVVRRAQAGEPMTKAKAVAVLDHLQTWPGRAAIAPRCPGSGRRHPSGHQYREIYGSLVLERTRVLTPATALAREGKQEELAQIFGLLDR